MFLEKKIKFEGWFWCCPAKEIMLKQSRHSLDALLLDSGVSSERKSMRANLLLIGSLGRYYLMETQIWNASKYLRYKKRNFSF